MNENPKENVEKFFLSESASKLKSQKHDKKLKMSFCIGISCPTLQNVTAQGSLTEGKASVQLTSSSRYVVLYSFRSKRR
jgi:hypothetical protein